MSSYGEFQSAANQHVGNYWNRQQRNAEASGDVGAMNKVAMERGSDEARSISNPWASYPFWKIGAMKAGPSPAGSNQLTGRSAQLPGSIAKDPQSTWNTNPQFTQVPQAAKRLPPMMTPAEQDIVGGQRGYMGSAPPQQWNPALAGLRGAIR